MNPDRPALLAPLTLSDVPAQLAEGLRDAQLTDRERHVVARLVVVLEEELGEDLLAVWLYGSRARAQARLEESDPDRMSDVDLLVVVADDVEASRRRIDDLSFAIAIGEGEVPFSYAVRVYDAQWVRDRREIESYFVVKVDRDKIVLAGSGLE